MEKKLHIYSYSSSAGLNAFEHSKNRFVSHRTNAFDLFAADYITNTIKLFLS